MWWILCSLLLIVFVCLLVDRMMKDDDFEKIPGPKGIFLVGNGMDFLGSPVEIYQNALKLCQKYKDIFKVKMGIKRIAVLLNPEDVEILLCSTKSNRKGYFYGFFRPWLNEGLLLSDGKKWHQRRKTLTPAFHFNILRHYNSVLIEKTNNFVNQLKSEVYNTKTDIYPYLTDFSLNSICETAMGTVFDEEASEIGKIYKNAVHKLGSYIYYRGHRIWLYPDFIYNLTPIGRDQKRLLKLIASFRNEVIERRKKSNNYKTVNEELNEDLDDVFVSKKNRFAMLDLLLEAEKEGKIDREGINEEVDTFIFEGYDTTATALQFAFLLLANHNDAQDKIVEESNRILYSNDRKPTMNDLVQMKYLEACIKESVRLYPPVHFMSRTSDQPIQLKNFKCPAGTDYLIPLTPLHTRSDQYVDPLEFRPERFLVEPTWHPFSYIPFSAGQRNCIGQKFAMLEMKLAISAVLAKYRLLPVTKPEDVVISMDMVLRTKDPVYVKFEKRNNKTV